MTKIIDGTKALALLQKEVKAKGEDFIYEDKNDAGECVYVNGGAPSCIVGHVVIRLKPSLLGPLGEWERGQLETGENTGVNSLQYFLAEHGIQLEPEAIDLLAEAQMSQDGGSTWGQALLEAQQAYDEKDRW